MTNETVDAIVVYLICAALLLLPMLFWGCSAPSYRLPCRVDGVSIEVLADHSQTAQRCRGELGSQPDYAGDVLTRPAGCADYGKRIIVSDDNPDHIMHEIRHFLRYFCPA